MKVYQCRNEKYYIYPLMIVCIIMFSSLAIVFLGSFESIDRSGTRIEQITFGWFCLFITLTAGIGAPIYLKISKKFNRTVEINEEGIIYKSKYRTINIGWNKIKYVYLNCKPYVIPSNKIVYFCASKTVPFGNKPIRVSDKKMWSEFTEEMLDEIKKHWWGDIGNEEYYNRYKKKQEEKQRRKNNKKGTG